MDFGKQTKNNLKMFPKDKIRRTNLVPIINLYGMFLLP